ncbi:hypothetical protein O181_113011, partial [Austropuccinia psidii MF-1]|nr:hypothetical protein [Austropuccinia psidii MF-1]
LETGTNGMEYHTGIPQDTENKNLCRHTQYLQTFLVIPTKAMAYIHGTATKRTVFIDNAQHPLIINSGAHCALVARTYLDYHPKLGNTNLANQGKEIQKKGNIRLNPEFVVLDDSHIQGFVLGPDYQGRYGIYIYNSKNRHITIGKNKEKQFSPDIYQISTHDPLEELLNEFIEGQFSTTLTRKQKLSLLKILRKNRPGYAIGEEPLGKFRGHDIEIYLDVERTYPHMLRIPPYPESLETRKEIVTHINQLLDMDFIRKIGHNEIVEITTPALITWHDGQNRLCADFRALNNYTKADRYPIPRIPHALDKLEKAKYITKMDCMKGFHQNGFKPNSMRLLMSAFDSKPEHKHDSQNTINQWYSQDTTKTWS